MIKKLRAKCPNVINPDTGKPVTMADAGEYVRVNSKISRQVIAGLLEEVKAEKKAKKPKSKPKPQIKEEEE